MKKSLLLIVTALLSAFFLCGAACEHSAGLWLVVEGEMCAECTLCGEAMSQPIDRQLLAESYLPGEWLSSHDVLNGEQSDASGAAAYTFFDDHSYMSQSFYIDTDPVEATWEFEGYEEAAEEEPERYFIKCNLENGSYNILTLTNVGTGESCDLYLGFSLMGIDFESHFKKVGDESLVVTAPLSETQVMERAVGSWHSYELGVNMTTLDIPAGEQSKIVLSDDGKCEYTAAGESSKAGSWGFTSEPEFRSGRHSCKLMLIFSDGTNMELTYSEDKSEDEESRILAYSTGSILSGDLNVWFFAKD